MEGDQIAFELAALRGLNLKPFARKRYLPSRITEFGVLLIFKLRMMSPFSMFRHFWVSIFVSLLHVEGHSFFFRFVLLVAYRVSRFFSVLIFLFCATTSYKPES